jgi:hypothetical protein
MGMSLFAADLCWVSWHGVVAGAFDDWLRCLHTPAAWRSLVDVLLLGACGGIFSVPLYANVQATAAPTEQSRLIAANNVLNALFMVASALFGMALAMSGVTALGIVALCAALNLGALALLCWRRPAFARAFVSWIRGGV